MSNNSSPRMQNFQLLASLLVTRSINQMTNLYFTFLSLQDPKQFCKIQCCALNLNTFQTLIGYLKLVQTKLIVGDFKFVQVIVQEKMDSPLKMHCIDMAPKLDALIQQFGIRMHCKPTMGFLGMTFVLHPFPQRHAFFWILCQAWTPFKPCVRV